MLSASFFYLAADLYPICQIAKLKTLPKFPAIYMVRKIYMYACCVVAGRPQVLTDSSDPRLLKHKPLPKARWGSEYSANFMSPLDFVYERGVWKGAPHLELFMKVDLSLSLFLSSLTLSPSILTPSLSLSHNYIH